MTRALRRIVHNWPLKIGALALSSLLYGGLVLSQTTKDFPGSIPIEGLNQASNIILLSDLGVVNQIRYVAPADLGLRIDTESFRATVDLGNVDPSAGHVTAQVRVSAVDERVSVLAFQPTQITIQLDRVTSRSVPVKATILGTVPTGLDIGVPTVDVPNATVTGPQSIVSRVAEVDARVPVDPSGIDVNRMVDLVAVDSSGAQLAPIDIEPTSVRVRVAVFTDRRTRTLPVSPVVVGTPAAGFEVASVSVNPITIQVEGDANDLAGLERADTQPISVSGASSDLVQRISLDLPTGVQVLGDGTVEVTVRLRAVTGTRVFEAGLLLVGASPDRVYSLSTDRVVVTIGGSVVDLNRLSGATLVLSLDVTGLGDGDHKIVPTANLTTGLKLLGVSPSPIVVTIATPTPSPS
jgi:YbbR domain-containing protein